MKCYQTPENVGWEIFFLLEAGIENNSKEMNCRMERLSDAWNSNAVNLQKVYLHIGFLYAKSSNG